MKRLRHGPSQVWGEPPTAQESPPWSDGPNPAWAPGKGAWGHRGGVGWGNKSPAVGKEPQALLGSVLAQPNGREAPAARRWGSLLPSPAAFEGAGGRGGERDLPRWVLSALTTAWPELNAHSSQPAAPQVALAAPRAHLYFAFCWGCRFACLAPGTSRGHSRNEPGREAELGSTPAPLLLRLGNPVKRWGVKPTWFPGCPHSAGCGHQLAEMRRNNPEHPPVWVQWKERVFGSVKTTHPVDRKKKRLFLNICGPPLTWRGLRAHRAGYDRSQHVSCSF